MIIAQLSDPHVTELGCDFDALYHTADRLDAAINMVNNMHPLPDLIFLTGDLVNQGGDKEYEALKPLVDKSQIPIYLGIGNHDNREATRKYFPEHTYLPERGFIQYVVEMNGLRMIMLDTNIEGKPQGTLCKERLDWLAETLTQAPDTPTVIFMHHPPIKTGIIAMDDMGFLDADAFGKVIEKHDQILRIFCGHLHRSIQGSFYGKQVQICPSTSHKILLHLDPDIRLATTAEPAETLMHVWDEKGNIVSHNCFVEDYPVLWELGKD